jgi:hypothetical protein
VRPCSTRGRFLVDAVPQHPRQELAEPAGRGELVRTLRLAVAGGLQRLPRQFGKGVVDGLRASAGRTYLLQGGRIPEAGQKIRRPAFAPVMLARAA